MITAVIFAIHFIFAVIIFTKKWQEDGLSSAFLNIALIGILFTVGWSITGMFSKLLMEPEGFGIYLDRDTFALLLLTIIEIFFYKFYYKEETTADGKEKL
jgi:hypothetical protein